jgi:hypothetical protein
MVKKLAEEQEKSVEQAEEAAKTSGTANPALEPDKSNMPEPGTTPDTAQIINTDQAKSLSPNVTVSGTKPDGEGGYELLDTVDPAVANAALLGPTKAQKPQNPSEPPEDTAAKPAEGEVLFECTADNQPFYSGNRSGTITGGPMQKGQKYVMSKQEADLLTQTKAGRIASSEPEPEAPPPKASAKNAKVEGSDAA